MDALERLQARYACGYPRGAPWAPRRQRCAHCPCPHVLGDELRTALGKGKAQLLHCVSSSHGVHHHRGPTPTGASQSANLAWASRSRDLTVPSGSLSVAAISLWVWPTPVRQLDRLALFCREPRYRPAHRVFQIRLVHAIRGRLAARPAQHVPTSLASLAPGLAPIGVHGPAPGLYTQVGPERAALGHVASGCRQSSETTSWRTSSATDRLPLMRRAIPMSSPP